MPKGGDAKAVLTEIIQKQMVILGPHIALLKARNVSMLTVDDKGVVTAIGGDAEKTMKTLVDEYVSLSGNIVKAALAPIIAKYPSLDK